MCTDVICFPDDDIVVDLSWCLEFDDNPVSVLFH